MLYNWKSIGNSEYGNFANGISNDKNVLAEFFNYNPSTNDLKMLRSMAAVSGYNKSLWAEIADKLEQIQSGDNKFYEIKIWNGT